MAYALERSGGRFMPDPNQLTPRSLSMPPDRVNNFWYTRQNPDLAVVFLHGIFSDSRSSWLYKGRGESVFWPDLVRTDPRLGQPSIYLAGYYTALDAGDFSVAQCAREVVDALQRPEADGTPATLATPSLVFVCHSTGGIVARYMLERYRDAFRNKAVGLALIASPSLGSDWANLLSLAARYYNQRLGLQLQGGGEALEEIHVRFRDLVNRRAEEMPGLFGMEAAENKMIFRDRIPAPMRWLFPPRRKVVSTLSAGQYFGEVKVLPGTDHFSAVKPSGLNHPSHEFLVTFLAEFRRVSASRPKATPASELRPSASGPPEGLSTADVASLLKVLTAANQPPAFVDLFEVVRDRAQVPAAIFRTGSARTLLPQEIPHRSAREGVPDIQVALHDALRQSGGALLVGGRAGLGKTREVCTLASELCERGWVICVARGDSDSRMNAPAGLPDELRGNRLLFVLDDLHIRAAGSSGTQSAYVDRLDSFLGFFERALSPGEFLAVGTARTEPHHRKQLGIDAAQTRWHRFRLYELPEFSLDALQELLVTAAQRVGIEVQDGLAARLAANSDRTPRTLVSNLRRAQERGMRFLDEASWLPTQGESWGGRFREACGRWTAADEVFEALHLIRWADLPTRLEYVTALGSRLASSDATTAAEGLVDMGLLGLRHGLLDAFGDEQLRDSLQAVGIDAQPGSNGHWQALREVAKHVATTHPEWAQDIVRLANRLADLNRWTEAETDYTAAIQLGQTEASVYSRRGTTRLFQENEAGAREDYDSAIARGSNTAMDYFGRGYLRRRQQDNAGAQADLTRALELGADTWQVYSERAAARLVLGDFAGAEADGTAAIELGRDDAGVYSGRGVARWQQKDYAGAESDFNAAVDRQVEGTMVLVRRGELRSFRGDLAGAEKDFDDAIERGEDTARVYALRGGIRLQLDKSDDAESDFSAAIRRGTDDPMVYGQRGGLRLVNGDGAGADADLTAAIDRGQDEAKVYYFRGLARMLQRSHSAAEADFTASIDREQGDPEVYQQRAVCRIHLDRLDEARQDCERAVNLAPDSPETHKAYGTWHLARREYEEARSRFRTALGIEPDNEGRFMYGVASLLVGRFDEAQVSYEAGLEDAASNERAEAVWNLDFWTNQQSDRVASTGAQAAVAAIRRRLTA